jgi:low affinity Fe/Cu permease
MSVDFTEPGESLSPLERRTPRPVLSRAAFRTAQWTGSGATATAVTLSFAAWMLVGVWAAFPRWWELVVTVGVPIIGLLMLIVVQHTQSHANRATQLKLDELLRASTRATNHLVTVEDASASDLDRIQQEMRPASGSNESGFV